MSSQAALRSELQQLGVWFHNLHLPNGLETAPDHPLGDFPAGKWARIHHALPESLKGWRVLDVGCNAGYYSFALAERGADVIGIDIDERYLVQARWASRHMQVERAPEFRKLSVYRLHELDGPFDLVWFMGVAYHLRHPLLALDIIRTLNPRHLMFQTMTFPDVETCRVPRNFPLRERYRVASPGWPKLGFVEHGLADDRTNWWVANEACARAMLRSSGFEVLDSPEHETWWCRRSEVDPAVRAELGELFPRIAT